MQVIGMTVGRLAERAQVSVEAIRYYQGRGLLATPARAHGRVRRYGEDSLRRLLFIKRAQRLGFTLAEVQTLLALNDGSGCARARALAEDKLAQVAARLQDLRAISRTLQRLIRLCHTTRGPVACPLIEALAESADRC